MRSYLSSFYAKSKFDINIVLNAVIVPILFGCTIIIWHYFGPTPDSVPETGIIKQIKIGFYRTMSHLDFNHLASNIYSLLTLGILLGVFRNNKILFLEIIFMVVISSILIPFFLPTGVGFSLVTNAILGLAIIAFTIFAYNTYLGDGGFTRQNLSFLVPSLIILLIAIPTSIVDILVVLDFVKLSEPGIFRVLVKDTPTYYSEVTSLGHTLGLITGIIIGLITQISSYYIGFSTYARYIRM